MRKLYGISMSLRKTKRRLGCSPQINSLCSSCLHPCRGAGDSVGRFKILSNHFKSARVEEAEKLFDEIPVKNVVSWSIMVHGYAKSERHRDSLECFSLMRVSGVAPNSFTLVGVLVSACGLRSLVLGQSVHGLILKAGLETCSIVGTALFDSYATCGNIVDSLKLFEGLKNPGLISWNAILNGMVSNRLFEESVALFNDSRQSGLVPNAVTVLTLIQACVGLELWSLCESIHGFVVKCGFASEISINNSVLNMYSDFLDLNAADKIYEEMEAKDVITLTTLMGLLVRVGHALDAIALFCQARDNGACYDKVTLLNLISACSIIGDLKIGRQIHAQAIISGFGSDLCLANSMITMYSKCGDLSSSRILFDQTNKKSLVSWTAMISGYVHNGCQKEALHLLIHIRAEEIYRPDPVLLIGALTAAGELAALELCHQLHSYAFVAGFPRYRSIKNCLITAYSKCGNVEHAHNIFKEMDCLRDIVSWNAIISGYGFNGYGETALTLFHEMKKGGEEDPDSVTYACILSACSHSVLVNDGLMIFKQLVEENRIRPSEEHFGCVVDLLARGGFLLDAGQFMHGLFDSTSPNVWRALLSGCVLYGNVGVAEVAARRLFEIDPGDAGQVALLSNVYALAGRFQDAEALRQNMENKRLVKDPGMSLLTRSPS